MTSHPYEQYRATRVSTASPAELVAMLYQGVLRFTQRAVQALERGDVNEAHAAFVRAQDIVAELTAGLNLEDGGEVAHSLLLLYDYVYRRLVEANVQKSAGPALEVLRIFRELLQTWQAIAVQGTGRVQPSRVALGVVA